MINIKSFYFIFLILLIFLLLTILFYLIYYYYFNNYYEKFELPTPTYNPYTYSDYLTKTPINVDKDYLNYILNNSHSLIPSNNDFPNISNSSNINPVIAIASETNLLSQLQKENNIIKNDTNLEKIKLEIIQDELLKIRKEIENKEQEKLQLSNEISKMDNMRYISNTILSMIIKGIDATMKKERELRNYENNLETKKEKLEKLLLQPTPTLPPVVIKEEQIKPIKDKLKELEIIINEVKNKIPNNICNNSNMPEPKKEAFVFNLDELQNPSYLWCMCNDNNKNTSNCIDYMACNKNYLDNKDKSSLIGDDLTLYMKCLTKFYNFPRYLNKNNQGISIA